MTFPPDEPSLGQLVRPDRASPKEGHMFDRDRFLAADHESRLHDEAQARRLAHLAALATRPRPAGHSPMARARLALGHRLVGTGRRLDAGSDPCGPATRPA